MQRVKTWLTLASMLLFAHATPAFADWELNMTEGVTDVSQSVYSLHMIILWVCVVIGIVVFGAMIYSMIVHRKSRGAVAANFHESLTVEIIWTVIPLLILVGMAIPATKTLAKIYDKGEAAITIEIVGYQWKWRYRYLNDDPDAEVAYFSNLLTDQDQIYNRTEKSENYLLEVDEPMVIPADTRVRFLVTAADVIHSWWVPELAVKKDAVPGIVNEAWTVVNEPGIYRGQCAELCGKDHGFMPVVVEVKEKAEFDAWLADKQQSARAEAELAGKEWSMDELMARGEQVYGTFCAGCHQANGAGIPGAFPALKDSPIALGDVTKHIDVIVNGVQGTAMQAFGAQLSEVDIAAVTTYERNAWGNNTGDVVTPQDVVQFKAGQ